MSRTLSTLTALRSTIAHCRSDLPSICAALEIDPQDAAQRLPGSSDGSFEDLLDRTARTLEPLLDLAPPDLARPHWRDLPPLLGVAARARHLGRDLPRALALLLGPARSVLESWFESEPLRSTLATDAVIGAWASPSSPGTGYVLFHHVMGETGGARGVWAYVAGGMGLGTVAAGAFTGAAVNSTLSTHGSGSQDLLSALDSAISNVSTTRGTLGATQNRLESTVRNLSVTAENLSAAESRIRDVDVAEEMMSFTRSQILQQAGTAMLAQANGVSQGALQLLG